MSGEEGRFHYWWAQKVPEGPPPVYTSSTMKRALCLLAICYS
jgi:hypothetical protein